MLRVALVLVSIAVSCVVAQAGGLADADAGIARLNAGDPAAAAELFTRAIQSKELSPDGLALTYHHRGMAFYKEGQTGRAILDYSTALWNDDLPKEFRPRTLNNRGLAFEAMSDFDSAMTDYSLAIKLNPNYAEAFGNRGNLHRKFNRHDQAIADYDSALRNGYPHPQFVFAWQGMSLEAQGKRREAMDAFRRALSIDPNFELAKSRLAKLEEGQSLGNLLNGGKKPEKDQPAIMSAAPSSRVRTASEGETQHVPWTPPSPAAPSIKVAQPAADTGGGVALRPAVDDQPKLPSSLPLLPAPKPVMTTPTASLPGSQPLAKKPSIVALAPQTVVVSAQSQAPVVSAAPLAPGPKILNASNATGEGGSDVEYAIQLGSFKSEELAESGWKKALKVSGDLLNGLSRVIEGAALPDKSTVFRLYAEALPDREAALNLCRTLRDRGAPCIVVRR